MADYRISNLTVRVEDQSLPKGVIHSQGRFLGDPTVTAHSAVREEDDGGDGGGCGCSCSCSCTCSCTCTCSKTGSKSSTHEIPEVELTVLRESLKAALADLEQTAKERSSG
ncbi:streptolysin S family bacteriocin [Kitasatospora sp. NPDC056651]|uniref:streptolysin S family bacteriocin n=1 Tax=Kitasatospora sp. NPDC056651 TaxID=3345892 RepID=UPI00369581EE